jgi:hypothetical protein
MKKLIGLVLTIIFLFSLNAQTWKTKIHCISEKSKVKTIKLKPEVKVKIGTLLLDSDSLKENKYYTGFFLGVDANSLQIKLKTITANKIYGNGMKQETRIPAKYYWENTEDTIYNMNIALSDIHILEYQKFAQKIFGNIEDYVLFSSLAVLFISPFICYNYIDGSFNAEQYQYWALGSTAGILMGFTFQMLGGHTKFQFKPKWPSEKAKVWSFK